MANVDHDEYEMFLGEMVTDGHALERWLAIGEALSPRDGWQFGWRPPTEGYEWPAWVFGEDEPWRLTLSSDVDGELFLYDEVMLEVRVRGTLERVVAWLDEHEHGSD